MKFYFKLRFIWTFISYAFYPDFLKLGTQFVMYYKLRCNSTQFVIYYKLRNYYKLQRLMAALKWYSSSFKEVIKEDIIIVCYEDSPLTSISL